MVRARIRRGSAALACALAGLAVAAGDAHAWETWYCGALLNSGSWCGNGSNHTYDYNKASYTGSGSVWVCARLLYADTTAQRESDCGWNVAENTEQSANGSYLYEAEVKHESGAARHTIYGYAWA